MWNRKGGHGGGEVSGGGTVIGKDSRRDIALVVQHSGTFIKEAGSDSTTVRGGLSKTTGGRKRVCKT